LQTLYCLAWFVPFLLSCLIDWGEAIPAGSLSP